MSNEIEEIAGKIVEARVMMLWHRPFFGNLVMRLTPVDATETSWCKTAATDGRRLYYNRNFIKKLTMDELIFLLGHEICHVVLEHVGTVKDCRDPGLLNMAQDYIINYILVKEQLGTMPDGGLYDPAYTDEMHSLEVYEILKDKQVEIQSTLDSHLENGEEGVGGELTEEGSGPNVIIRLTGEQGPPVVSEEDLVEIRREIQEALCNAAAAAEGEGVPPLFKRIIAELTTSILPWRQMLQQHIISQVKGDYTWSRPSKKARALGLILPGQTKLPRVEIECGIDASGSMNEDQIRDLLSEVKGIARSFADYKIGVFTFDTAVHNRKEYTPANIDELDFYEITGGGGTSFECCFDFMKEAQIKPKRFIMFTDGLPNYTWGDPDYCPTLFIIHGSTSIRAPYGETAYYLDGDR